MKKRMKLLPGPCCTIELIILGKLESQIISINKWLVSCVTLLRGSFGSKL